MDRDIDLFQFWHEVGCGIINHPAERLGQNLFNTLHHHRPELANKLRSTPADPFFDDRKYEEALEWIEENW